jgi:prevent-host-death family protein
MLVLYTKQEEVHSMPQIRPITDLRNTNEISDACHAAKEPIFITKNGYGDLVVMSIETYEQIAETQRIDDAIAESEEEYKTNGILLDAEETLASLRRKHFA